MERGRLEEAKNEDLDAIQNVYFDCNALDRLAEHETASAAVNDPSEELKMDKNLGLFEMINAGDFSTVGGAAAQNEGAAASSGASNGAATFDFDAYNNPASG